MAKTALEVRKEFGDDAIAAQISDTWHTYNNNRFEVMKNWEETRNYVFATDTTTTTNQQLPWKNKTTLPKLCQIRDNLHSNYLSAIFSNDEWLKWEGYSLEDSVKQKAEAIQAYMMNKVRNNNFRETISRIILDFIDMGNGFGEADFEASFIENEKGERTTSFIGPVAKRISPYDIVFDPLADSFKDSFKIVRAVKTAGALKELLDTAPDKAEAAKFLLERGRLKEFCKSNAIVDNHLHNSFQIDGFGSYSDYLQSNTIEFLTFYGDLHVDGKLLRGKKITVVDRLWTVKIEDIPSWQGFAPIFHVGWRLRPDNLWAMGPLDNLVGMQYRIDHIENLKADAMDLAVMPPLVIKGEVEQFKYGPGEKIFIDENGEVSELARNVQWVIQADNEIALLEQRMEQYAGAPREAMGIRSPGEKTMYEVQQLENAAGRIFQEKINAFEVQLLEPLLNAMLETARRNLNRSDVIRVMDDDLGITTFLSITKDDLSVTGKLRPIGSRHFAAKAQMMQNLTGLANTPIWQNVAPHLSAKNLATLVEEMLGVKKYSLFAPNKGVYEQQDVARTANQAGEDLLVEQQVPAQ